MNIVRMTAAGRPVRVGPRLLLLSPPSMRDMGLLLNFLAGKVAPPEDAAPGWLPQLVGDAAFAAYASPEGATMLLYATTRRDHPGLSIEDIAGLAAGLDDASIGALVRCAFVRAEGEPPRPRRKDRGEDDRRGKGLEAVDFGRVYESESVKRFPPQVLSGLSIDQFENLLFEGNTGPDESLSFDEVMEIYHQYRPTADGGPSPGGGD